MPVSVDPVKDILSLRQEGMSFHAHTTMRKGNVRMCAFQSCIGQIVLQDAVLSKASADPLQAY